MSRRATRSPFAPWALGLLLALGPLAAAADGFTGLAEPSVSGDRSRTSGPATGTSDSESLQLGQRYRLTFDRTPLPLVRLNASTSYEQQNSVNDSNASPRTRSETSAWTLGGRLDLGGGIWNVGGGYDVRGASGQAGVAGASTLYTGAGTAFAIWRPVDLPSLDLRYANNRVWQGSSGLDQRSELLAFQSGYTPFPSVELRYRASAGRTRSSESALEDRVYQHALRAAWGDNFFVRRLTIYATAEGKQGLRESVATGPGAFRETQQTLASPLSAVERFPLTALEITLDPNPALADGVTTTGAGVDIGYGRTEAGDLDARDLGGRFPDAATPVNQLRVWVDKRLPVEVANAFAFAAYRSDDNVTWTPVGLAGTPAFGAIENRFEIPIATTSARYLKVVVRPLAVGVTAGRDYQQILVTELQASFVEALTTATRRNETRSGQVTLSSRLLFVRSWSLAWDGFADVGRDSERDFTRVLVSNGLSFTRRVADPAVLSGRVERSDSDEGDGLQTTHRSSLSMSLEPLPTLGGTLSASASRLESDLGVRSDAASAATVRADLYQGLSLSGNYRYGLGWRSGGAPTRRTTASGDISVVPNRWIGFTGTFTYTSTTTVLPGADRRERAARVDGSATLTPVPALVVNGSIGRELYRQAGTLGSLGVTASPFAGGALQLSFTFAETLDTTIDSRSRRWGPSVRWRMARWAFLDLAYTDAWTRTGETTFETRSLFAKLLLTAG